MGTLKGGIFPAYFYVISLLNKISFGILKEMILFLSMRAADVLEKGAAASVCLCGCVCACRRVGVPVPHSHHSLVVSM